MSSNHTPVSSASPVSAPDVAAASAAEKGSPSRIAPHIHPDYKFDEPLSLPKSDVEKIIVFPAGTKGGAGKSSFLPLLYSWYRTNVGVTPACVDYDPEVGSFARTMFPLGQKVLDSSAFLPPGQENVEGAITTLKDLVTYVSNADEQVFLVDLPASSLTLGSALTEDFDPTILEMSGIRLVFLHLLSDASSIPPSLGWMVAFKEIPHVSIAVLNNFAGNKPVPHDGFAGAIRFPLFDANLGFGSLDSKIPFPYFLMLYLEEQVRGRLRDLDGTALPVGFQSNKFNRLLVKNFVVDNWGDDRVKNLTGLWAASLLYSEILVDLGQMSKYLTTPEMDRAIRARDLEEGFQEYPLEVAYSLVRDFPDITGPVKGWKNLIPLRKVVDLVYNLSAAAPAPAAVAVAPSAASEPVAKESAPEASAEVSTEPTKKDSKDSKDKSGQADKGSRKDS